MSAPHGLVVIGGGGHACVVIEAARSRPDIWEIVGFTDPDPTALAAKVGARRLGDDAEGFRLIPVALFVLGVGAVGVSSDRAAIVARFAEKGASWATVIHARAWVSPSACLEPGVVVLAGALVNARAELGDHCVVNTGAIVEHDTRLGAFAQVGPGACLGGGVAVGTGAYLGLGCRIRDHVQIGQGSVVGMGAVVTCCVAENDIVVGVPAKSVRMKS